MRQPVKPALHIDLLFLQLVVTTLSYDVGFIAKEMFRVGRWTVGVKVKSMLFN